MSKELIITLRKTGPEYIGPRWIVDSIRKPGLLGWLREKLKRKNTVKDYSESDGPDIGVALTWDQYNILADRIGTFTGSTHSLYFVPPPKRTYEETVRI